MEKNFFRGFISSEVSMRIQNLQTNLSFKKELQAKCSVVTNEGKHIPCSIYKLEPGKDKNYFSEIKNRKDWNGAQHFDMVVMNNSFLKKNSPFSIYTMESQKGHCIGYAEACDFDEELEILSMESAPALTSHKNKSKSGVKYIGENFVSFFVNLAKKKLKVAVNIEASPSSVSYYTDKCNFQNYLNNPEIEDEPLKLSLPKYQFSEFLDKNKKHTKSGVILAK